MQQMRMKRDSLSNDLEILGWDRFGCYGHELNLLVCNALGNPDVGELLTKGRKRVTFLHSSPLSIDVLLDRNLLDKEKTDHKLIMDVPTCWNSTLKCYRD